MYSYLHHAFLCDTLRWHPSYNDWACINFLGIYAHLDFTQASVPANFDVGDSLVRDPSSGKCGPSLLPYFRRQQPLLQVDVLERSEVWGTNAALSLISGTARGRRSMMLYADKTQLGLSAAAKEPVVHQVMFSRADDEGTVLVHGFDVSGKYGARRVQTGAAAEACQVPVGPVAHRQAVYVLKPDATARWLASPETVRQRLEAALAGQGMTSFGGDQGSGEPGLVFGLDATSAINDHGLEMLSGSLPIDIRPLHVQMEHKQGLARTFGLLASRGRLDHDAALERHLEGLVRAAEALRFFMLRCAAGHTPKDAASWWTSSVRELMLHEASAYRSLLRGLAARQHGAVR